MRKVELKIEKDGNNLSVIARVGRNIVSSVFATVEEKEVEFGPLQTNPQQRGNGIGSRVLCRLERSVRDNGGRRLRGRFSPEVGSEDSVRSFYENRGYRIIEGKVVKDL